MAWKLEGTYFENCSCEVACPCTAADFAVPADYDRCQFLMAFHVDSGDIDGLAVSDRTVAVVGDTPGRMLDGGWRVGLLVDDRASAEAFINSDPFSKVGLFGKVEISRWRKGFLDGKKIPPKT